MDVPVFIKDTKKKEYNSSGDIRTFEKEKITQTKNHKQNKITEWNRVENGKMKNNLMAKPRGIYDKKFCVRCIPNQVFNLEFTVIHKGYEKKRGQAHFCYLNTR
jgi:hypothetical protein